MLAIHELKPLFKVLVMSRSLRSRRVLAGLGLVCVLPFSAQVMAGDVSIDIPAQPLPQALQAFGQQTNQQVIYNAADMAGLKSTRVSGKMSTQVAIAELLKGTGVRYSFEGNTLIITRSNASSAIELGATTISGRQLGVTTEGTNSYTTGAVTIGKGEQKLKDIPQSVSVLTRKRMDDQNITNLTQAIESTPGMSSIKSPGPGMFIYARGFDIEALQYDGVPVSRNVYSLGSYITENMAVYDRVEFLRGAAGLLQGANSPGGAINMVRKRPQAVPTVTLSAKAGSWDRYASQADVGGPLNSEGTIRGRAVVNYEKGNSFTDYVSNWEQTVYGAVDFDLSPDTVLGIGASNKKSHSTPYLIGLPRYSDGTALNLGRSSFAGASWNRAMNDQTSVFLDLEHHFNDHWKVKAAAMAMNESNEATYQFITGTIAADGTGARYADYSTDFSTETLGFDAYINGDFEALSFKQNVMLGANYTKLKTNDAFARAFTPGVDIDNIDHHRPFPTFDSIADSANLTESTYDVRQKGIYGTWRVNVTEPLTLIVGARSSWYDFAYDAQTYFARVENADPVSSTAKHSGKVTPYYGLVYALSDQWSAYASYSDVFIPQTVRDTSQSILKPVEGTNYELGLKGELMDGQLNTSFAIFRYDHENRAVSDISGGLACDGWYCSVASGKVRSQGFEAEVSGEVAPGLQVSSSYTYNTTKFLEDADNKGKVFSTWTPKHMVRIWADYRLPGDWHKVSVGAGVNTQSSTVSYDRQFDQPGFSIWSSRVGYDLTDEVNLAVNFNNIFDKKYFIPSYSQLSANNYYGDPRNMMFSVTYKPQF